MSRSCTRCKNPSWPLHKRRGILLCESCLAELEGGGIVYEMRVGFKGLFMIPFAWAKKTLKSIRERMRGTKQIKLDEKAPNLRISKNYVQKPKAVKMIRIGSSYKKIA